MAIRAIVLDIDGTITDAQRRLSTKAVEAIRSVEQPVILASGNVLPIVHGIATYIGTKGPVISENGGIVNWGRRTEMLGDKESAEKAFAHLVQHLPLRRLFTDQWRLTEVGFYPDVDIDDVKRLIEGYDVELGFTGFAYHLKRKDINKFKGLNVCCEWLGIDAKDVAAIGDADNDIELIKNCGLGIAVANASDELKRVADHVTRYGYGEGGEEALAYILDNVA